MRKLLQKLLGSFVIRMANKYASRPNRERIHEALDKLFQSIIEKPGAKGLMLPFDFASKIIIFSDQHKGARNFADDFATNERNYISALDYYYANGYQLVCLGDSEELWENTLDAIKKHNRSTFEAEKLFLQRNGFIKIFGNHDLYWDNDPLAAYQLEKIYGQKIKAYEGLVLTIDLDSKPLQIFLTHGHQGDLQSDGNWFSKWFVSTIWAPFQAYLRINPNTPAYNNQFKSAHNQLMYEWAAGQEAVLITGHTHQPVFNSLTHMERLYIELQKATAENDVVHEEKIKQQMEREQIVYGSEMPIFKALQPNYFNSGCCCFNDGDITGIEICEGKIKLIKWEYQNEICTRMVLEEASLKDLRRKV